MPTYSEIQKMTDGEIESSLQSSRTEQIKIDRRSRELRDDIRYLEAEQKRRASKKALETSGSLKLLKEQYEAAQRVFGEFSSYGARDTEPDGEFQLALKRAFEGEERIPKTGDDWQLYTSSMKCGNAARRLTAATKRVVKLILNLPQKDVKHALEIIDLWRVGEPDRW